MERLLGLAISIPTSLYQTCVTIVSSDLNPLHYFVPIFVVSIDGCTTLWLFRSLQLNIWAKNPFIAGLNLTLLFGQSNLV